MAWYEQKSDVPVVMPIWDMSSTTGLDSMAGNAIASIPFA